MSYCLLLPTYLPNEYRRKLAVRSYASLAETIVPEEDLPLTLFVVCRGEDARQQVHEGIDPIASLALHILIPNDTIGGSDQSICWGVESIFTHLEYFPERTHFILLSDDMLYHPSWFVETKAIVERHPGAKAWSTYRSAHTLHHRTISVDRHGDHLVTSLAGNGTCWSFDEWRAWGIKSSDGQAWPVPTGGDTIDLHHPWARPGERWVTGKSYMQHLGLTQGVHCHTGVPEFALDFIGEEA
jgi:hypothetical protein